MPEKKLPSYEVLFGNLDYTSADEYRSVLSPAAYLADIMDLKDWKYGDAKDAVDDRREDISEILLNAENTITEIPYLDVVNRIMENRVAKNDGAADAYDSLKTAEFPFNLPFNRHKTEINCILGYFKADPMKFYKAFTASPEAKKEAMEYLGLCEEEYKVITTPVTETEGLKAYYGLKNEESFSELYRVTRFRKAAELSALQVTELLFQSLSDEEKAGGVSQKFFINRSALAGYLFIKTDDATKEERIFVRIILADGTTGDDAPAADYYDRINRFIRLSRKTGLSVADIDLVLTKACNGLLDENAIQILAVVKWLQNTYEIPVEEICTFFSAIKDYGKGETTTPADLFDRLFNNGYEKNVGELSGTELKNRIRAGLGSSESEYHSIEKYLSAAGKNIEPVPSKLALPYRIKKLATLFEIPIDSLFTLFGLFDKNSALIERAKFPLPIGFEQTIADTRDIITVEEISGPGSTITIRNVLWLIQLTAVFMQWLNENDMTVEQLEFICTEHSGGAVDGVLTRTETEDLFRDLNGQFGTVLFKAESLLSGIIDKLTADLLYEKISDLETGVCTDRGIIRSTTATDYLLPRYLGAIREKLFIEPEDLAKTGLSSEGLRDLFRMLQNKDYIDLDGYVGNTNSNIEFFADPANAQGFLQETEFSAYTAIVFKEMAERVKAYSSAKNAAESECAAIAQKISVQAVRQQSVILGALEGGMNASSDILKILCTAIFRTPDETEETATVRFMTPLMEAFDREAAGGELAFDASLMTSFRRLQQFSLLVSKTELKARELEVLFFVKEVQNALPEKLKLPAPFNEKIDAIYSDADNNIIIFSGKQYIRFSGKDYSLDTSGDISALLPEIPDAFKTKIDAAIREWAPDNEDRQTYFFSGSSFFNAGSKQTADTASYWGKVRNHIAEDNRVDAAYRGSNGTLYLFSGDQYVRYSDASREFVDEGYPKNILRNWNNEEGQIKLPFEIREKVDSILSDSVDGETKTYFFSNDRFVDSSDPANVLKTKDRWGRVVNNIVDKNTIDDVLVKDGKTYLFSGDQYTRYSGADYSFTDEGYPKKIANNWNNEGIITISGEYNSRIDAALKGTDKQVYLFNGNTFISTEKKNPAPVNSKWGKVLNNIKLNNRVDAALEKDGKTYLFSGDQYYRYSGPDYTVLDEGYPVKIARWNELEDSGTLPDAFNSGISAAFTARDNAAYFFSGNQYVGSKSGAAPKQVKESWARVRNSIQENNKLDAGFVAPDGKTYLFGGDQFFRYSGADYTTVDEGYPKKIKGNWGNLPDSFCQKIDAAFRFNVDGADRLYLFSGSYYVRYSGSNYSQIDSGYPKELDNPPNPEGPWFEPIFKSNPQHQFNDRIIKTIFTDQYNNKPRINYFFNDRNGVHKMIKYEYINNNYRWSNAIPVSSLNITPFTSVDVGFSGADGKVYLFSGNNVATMKGDYNGITAPSPTNGTWGRVLNRFHDLNRVDAAFTAASGFTYLFCDDQYVKYSGEIAPGNTTFYAEEGYPKKTTNNWNSENAGIQVPAVFRPAGYALLAVPGGTLYCFTEGTFITSSSRQPVAVNEVWGKVKNNFESLNRVDAAFVHNGKTYLFCGDQYTRYSSDYSGYADERYPRTIANIGAQDGIEIAAQFPDEIKAIMEGADGSLYVFTENTYVSSSDPSTSADVKSKFGIVRNSIAETGIIDAADTTSGGVLYLFSGDQYVRYSAGSRDFVEEGYPKTIAHWDDFEDGDMPDAVTQGIKASFTDSDGAEYFFLETGDYFSLGNPSVAAPINSKWGKVKNNIQETGIVDAAFIAPNGKTYLFSGSQYVRYSPESYVKDGYPYVDESFPKAISDNWGDLPAEYHTGIDAGFVFDGRTYLFKGDAYIRYSDPACKKIDADFPRKIASEMSLLPDFRLNDVKTFQQFKALSRNFNVPDNSILDYLEDSKNGLTENDQRSRLSSLTEWSRGEIDLLLTQPEPLSGTDIADIQVLTEMNFLFDLSERMGSLPSTVKSEAWDKIYGGTSALKNAAAILAGQLKTVMGAAAWKGLSAELRNKMNLAKRDALLGYLIFKMGQDADAAVNWIENPRDLYEYLLIDVEMAEEATTSRIQEAIMCMQLFYHRMLMSLEDEDQPTVEGVRENLKKWWIWMKNYRVWEANRKVFLYPENYIRPELRLDKSPEFKELEESLLQGDITEEAVAKAYKTYLEKYTEISKLKIAGGYVYNRSDDLSGGDKNVVKHLAEKKIIMFGHSNTEPKKYYYMTGEILEEIDPQTQKTIQTIDWAPWKEIGITIDAEKVYPVYSFNRLFVFWVEVRERDQSTYTGTGGVGPGQKVTQYDPVIYYSFFNLNGEWVNPQKLFDIGKFVDQLALTDKRKQLFFDDRKKTTEYIPARDVLNGASLYVTNPITSWYYNSGEYIYISYEARHSFKNADNSIKETIEFGFHGKFKSNFEFEYENVAQNLMDRLDKNVQFPFEKFGIKPVSFSHWKGFFNDSFSAPWFNFNAEGGSFLLKPVVVPDPPDERDDMELLNLPGPSGAGNYKWENLPDAGFTDDQGIKHLFYRESQDENAPQFYRFVENGQLSEQFDVNDRWGISNIFVMYPEGIESAAVKDDKVYIATAGDRYMSYTGPDLKIIDQVSVEETKIDLSDQLLPDGSPESWQRVKEDLADYIDTLHSAFVFRGDERLYLVADPVTEGGQSVREYTIPDMNEFWAELSALVPDSTVADTLRTWTSARSANFYTERGNKRLYITSGGHVFVKDYIAGTNSICTVAELTHPGLMTPEYDPTPVGAAETPWINAKQNLMQFIIRLTGVGSENGSIRFIAVRQDNTYEYTEPVAEELFDILAEIINDAGLSPAVAALTELSAADLFVSGVIKRLYLRSGNTVVLLDYGTGVWSVKYVSDLIHPDVTAKVDSLSGRLPSQPAVPWSDVAEDFSEYMATVGQAFVWNGIFYLLTPKANGGSEYTTPSASEFWSAVAETMPSISGFSTVDSACVLSENGAKRKLLVTCGTNVVLFNFSSGKWSLSTISKEWGVDFGKVDGAIQAPDGNLYIFSGMDFAAKVNGAFTVKQVAEKWGFLRNVLEGPAKIVDSAFMAGDGRVYMFSDTDILCYANARSGYIEQGYPRKLHFINRPEIDPATGQPKPEIDPATGEPYPAKDFIVYKEDVQELFAADGNSKIEIIETGLRTNTAFVQAVNKTDTDPSGKEKLYLLLDITAKITKYVWQVRWRWWGGWRMHHHWLKRHRAWWGWWWPEYYQVPVTHEERKSVYMRFSRTGDAFVIDEEYPRLITGNWSNFPGDFNRMVTATFEDEENGKKIFYAVRSLREKINGEVRDTNLYVKYTGESNFPREISEEPYEIIRLTSNTSEVLKQKLFIDGIGGLLSLETQCVDELPGFGSVNGTAITFDEAEKEFFILKADSEKDVIHYKATYLSSGHIPFSKTLDYGSINSQYYWEIFFHAPFLIAQAFNNAQKFEEGKKWYEYVFDPTELNDTINDDGLVSPKPYWKFLPFHEDMVNSQPADLNDLAQYNRYRNDPFDPHAIAGLRQIAYRKTIVMNYIDNLLDWGDMLFRQYTRETINEARMFYVLAYDLLGKKPELLGTKQLPSAQTYKELRNPSSTNSLNMALVEMENLPVNAVNPLTGTDDLLYGSLLDPYGYFYIPENREFADYWDRVEDRLYKIRYSLNIEGVKQLLPLFEPPIDVMALVRAVGSGMGLAQALADFNVAVPHYRFGFILGKARELTSRLTQFGQSFLSALEKKDAEELALLRNTHEKAIMKLTLDIKNAQLQDSEETVKALRANLKSAKTREAHYSMLLSSGLSPFEQSQLGLLASAQMFTNLSQVFSISSSVSGIAPEAGVFAFHWGGHNLAALFTGLSQSFNAISNNMSYRANLASILGGYHRRGQDWGLQQRLAQSDIENIERQIAGAEIKVKIARLDIETAKTNIKNLESVDTFMKGKFTNLQLYRWMTGKLAGLYFQTYQMALDMAKWAQKSFQFELGYKESEVSFISSLYWDSLKKGLLAGETLQVDLDRMEKAYIEKNQRRFEISKTISLAQIDPLALLELREKRVCEFTLGEELFDYDFPGHYRRQIKTISITFPAVAGPYENINATLTQLSHRTLIDPDKEGAGYLLTYSGDQPLSVRADWRTNQQIALSRGVNDAGLFQLNFQDERYLPFEGTGAVSTWRLELNGQEASFDVYTLSDVIIKIEYTALQGGEVFGAAVKKKLKPSSAAKLFNLSQDFSADWNSFMENPAGGLNIKVAREMFPDMSKKYKVTGLYMLYALSKEGVKDIGDTAMKLNTIDVKQATLINLTDLGKELSISASGSIWKLLPASNADEFTPENISNIALVCLYEKKPKF